MSKSASQSQIKKNSYDIAEFHEAKNQAEVWYAKGLSFKCTECGKCCTGSAGYVWVSPHEIEEMAKALNISISKFMKKYTRKVGQRYSLLESKKNYDCIFLKDKKCLIYQARPTQCRTFPFWPQNLSSQEAWKETGKSCEGIQEQIEPVAFEKIEQQKLIQIKRNQEANHAFLQN